jgi:hypothetical protein
MPLHIVSSFVAADAAKKEPSKLQPVAYTEKPSNQLGPDLPEGFWKVTSALRLTLVELS